MKKKVTLRELVGTKIVYALLIAVYYWMWARRDWHDYYETIQYVVAGFTFFFLVMQSDRIRKYHKEEKDELAQQNLLRADSICFKILLLILVVTAFMGAMGILSNLTMGYVIVGAILAISIIRFVLFGVMDSKGV